MPQQKNIRFEFKLQSITEEILWIFGSYSFG